MSASTPPGNDGTRTDTPPVRDSGNRTDSPPAREDTARPVARDRRTVFARQKEEHGGVKIGSAFFGFLTAIGVAALLTALLTAAGTAISLATGSDATEAAGSVSVETISIVGGAVLLVVVFVAYFCGGYVASRMARFNGIVQGVAVWVWALVVAAVVAVLGLVAGDQYDVLADLNTFPRIPVSEGDLTTGGIVAALVLVVVSLLGAIAGGLAGMRFHRRVDRTGLPD